MILAQSIFNQRGASYLVKGQPITKGYIHQLEKVGIPTVTVTTSDPDFQLLPPDDIVAEETRANAIKHVYHAFQTTEQDGHLDVDMMEDVAEKIIFDLIDRKANLVQLTDIRLHDTYTFGHSVNVAILSSMLGMLCHYTKKDLQILTLGALLHDLGKIAVDDAVLRKPGKFTPEEFDEMKKHASEGARIVDSILEGTENEAFHKVAVNVAHYHHERWDGSGYPEGLKGEEIPIEARIMAIADVYDALVSKRVYKDKFSFDDADKIMMESFGKHFDKRLEKYYVAAKPKLEVYYKHMGE